MSASFTETRIRLSFPKCSCKVLTSQTVGSVTITMNSSLSFLIYFGKKKTYLKDDIIIEFRVIRIIVMLAWPSKTCYVNNFINKCFYSVDGDLANTLICLDVSENRLGPEDIYRLSTSKLKQLNVSANQLMAVPESITDYHCFLLLEHLDLSDNGLSSSKTFYVLSTLHNLQALDMSTNRITFIPYLITKQVTLL
jgi:Leucine-rich repeat (LRR) protein